MKIKVLTITSVLMSLTCHAADTNSQFAVKGAGRKDCATFVEAMAEKNKDYFLFGGWLEGYLSGYNQAQAANYDITPWQSTELLLSLLNQQCKQNLDMPFLTATNVMIKTLFPVRLKQNEDLIQVAVNGYNSYYYKSTVTNAKQRLRSLGFITYEVTSEFNERDVQAFSSYQQKMGLKVTGVPDQLTLTSLLLKKRSTTQ